MIRRQSVREQDEARCDTCSGFGSGIGFALICWLLGKRADAGDRDGEENRVARIVSR
jgi:hypothetical protein